jgi:PAS domain S-box-containing protein
MTPLPDPGEMATQPGATAADEASALRDGLRRHRVLADSSLVGIFESDAQGNLVYINDCGADIVGMAREQAYGRGWEANLHPQDRDRVLAEASQARAQSTPFRSEYRFRHEDGRVVWVLGRFIPDRDASGRLHGHVGTAQDITALKEAQERLRGSERRYAALVENSVAGIWHIDSKGSTLYVSPSMRQLLELDDDDRNDDLPANPGRLIYEFIAPQSWELMRSEHAKRGRGVASTYEVEIVGKKGGRRNVVICGAPGPGLGGEPTSMIATVTDITDRKRMEEALRHNEERLRVMTEQVPAVLWTADATLRFTSSVGAGLNAMGLRPGQVVGMAVPVFLEQDRKAGPAAVESHRHALLGISSTYEQFFEGRAYQCHVEPLRGPQGSIDGVIGVALDVTDRKKAEDAVRDARDWLEVRVHQRTEELTHANVALLREVEERKSVEERLRQSQARYASILNSQQTLVSRSDPQGRITYVNAAHQRSFGSREGDSVFVNVHPDDVEATRRAMEDLARPPFTCTLEQRCEVRGRWRWFLWQVGVIRDRAGQLVEYQGVGFDITELKQAQEMLLESTRRARESAEQARAAAERERLAAEEARQVAEFNRRLALELDHRVRNNLAGLLSLVAAMRTTSRDVDSFAGAMEGRLVSMSNVHQLLADTDWRPVDLRTLVTSLLAAAERLCPNRIDAVVEGPTVAVSPRQAPAVSMILMEWFTNSCKYGAHTVRGGGLRVAWVIVPTPTAPPLQATTPARISLRWTESGGPPPRLPIQASLGTDLVASFANLELHGSFRLGFPGTGADHLLEFPIEAFNSARG